MKRVLAIDGGGIRGIIPAVILQAFESTLDGPAANHFDLLVGTSAGGLVVLGMTLPDRELRASELVDLFEADGSTIFRGPNRLNRFRRPKYNGTGLKEVLQNRFRRNNRFRDARRDVMVTAYDTAQRQPRLMKSWEAAGDANGDLAVWEVGVATAAAPTYFPSFVSNDWTLIDGGMAANNPAALALAEAKRKWPQEDVVLISIGTGRTRKQYFGPQIDGWGEWGWARPAIDFLFEGASDSTHYVLEHTMQRERYFRFQLDLPVECEALDDASDANIEKLKAKVNAFVDLDRHRIEQAVTALTVSPTEPPHLTLLDFYHTRDNEATYVLKLWCVFRNDSPDPIEITRLQWHATSEEVQIQPPFAYKFQVESARGSWVKGSSTDRTAYSGEVQTAEVLPGWGFRFWVGVNSKYSDSDIRRRREARTIGTISLSIKVGHQSHDVSIQL